MQKAEKVSYVLIHIRSVFFFFFFHDISLERIKLHDFWRQGGQSSTDPWGLRVHVYVLDVGVLGQFGGAEREACVGGGRYIGVRCEQGSEGGRRVQWVDARVDAHADAPRHQTVSRLQDGPRGGQQVGDGAGRRVGEQGGRGWRRGLGRVGGADVREGVTMHRGRDEGLWTARLGVVAVPFLVTGAVVLDLHEGQKKKDKPLKPEEFKAV